MALYTEESADVLANILAQSEEERRRKELEEYNRQKTQLDNKYDNNGGGLGGLLGGIIGGIGKAVGDIGTGVYDLVGSGAASFKDLVEGKAGTGENLEAFKKDLYKTDSLKDAYAKSAGTALNAATSLGSTVVPGLSAGGAASKIATSALGNAGLGAISGAADELQQQGENASIEGAANRAISGAAAGLATGGLNKKIGNATGKVGGALLNNKLATSTIGRGALSGAVGGATGAGTSAALGGGDILGSAVQGGLTGAGSGALQAGVMSGVNKLGRAAKGALGINGETTPTTLEPAETAEPTTTEDAITARKQKQFELIQEKNPMTDDYHTGIRKAGDIMTFNEALASPDANNEYYSYPDWTMDNAKAASQKGTVTVYSSYPIEEGTFVTPSKMMAQDYAGSGQVYSKEIPLDNVAWISGDEGNYAPIKAAVQKPATTTDNAELATSFSGQLRKKSAEKLLDQYGTISKPMAKSANAIDNVQKVADAGFEKPSDVEGIIGKITGSNGKVTKLTSKLVASARPVNTFDGINDLIDQEIAMSGLVEADAKSVRNILESQLASLPSRREGSISYTDNAQDVFDVVKRLEKRSANLKGKSGTNYSTTSPERVDKAAVIDSIANVLKDRIYENAAPVETILTPDVRQELISYAPKNKKWQNYVDNTIMASKNVGELRNSVAPFVNMGKIIEDQYLNYGTYGQRVGDSAQQVGKVANALFKMPFVGQIAEAAANSNIAKRATARAYNAAADLASAQPAQVVNRPTTAPGNNTTTTTNAAAPNNLLGNLIGRTEGISQAKNNVQNARKAEDYQNLEAMLGGMAGNAGLTGIGGMTSLGMGGTAGTTGTLAGQTTATANPQIEQLGQISRAMDLALNAGDITAYNQLASLYSTAYKMYELQNPSQEKNKLSSSQQSALRDLDTSENTLSQLKEAYQKAGGAKGLAGNLDEFGNWITGGNINRNLDTYESLKNSLGAAIIKNVVNLGGTEQDAKRYTEMLPKVSDSPEQAAQKFADIEQLLKISRESVYKY